MTGCGRDVLVILPTYNREALLPHAIESVLTQEYSGVRLVIVDDGSTDDTRSLCASYQRRHADRIVYEYQANRGCASARNRGLAFLTEDVAYVCFLDSDDRLLPGKLSREVALLEGNPGADFVYSDYLVCEAAGGRDVRRSVAAADRPERFAIEHFLTNEAKSAGLLYRSRVVRDMRFREDLRYNEDSEFLQRVAIEHHGVYSSEPGCWVRVHKGSKSRDLIGVRKAELQTCQEILRRYPEFAQTLGTLGDWRLEQLRRRLFVVLVLRSEWAEARSVARGFLEHSVVASRLKVYGVLRHSIGSVLGGLQPPQHRLGNS